MPATAAVVSLFNPSEDVLENAAALLRQVDQVVVVDDGSPQDPEKILGKLAGMGCIVERMPGNSGIAAALNRGITRALEAGPPKPEFILTMDQDSLLDDGYVDALLCGAADAEQAGIPVGMVAPASIRGLPTRRSGVVNGVQLGGEPIQSGLLIPVRVLEQVGLLQADLFIDGVDTEYYLRCLSAGLKPVIAKNAALDHALGNMTAVRLFGREVSLHGRPLRVRTAATWRYYYIFRNRVLLARKYGRKHLVWALKGFLADYRHLAIVTVLVQGRRQRLSAVFAGVSDGVRGVSGRRPDR